MIAITIKQAELKLLLEVRITNYTTGDGRGPIKTTESAIFQTGIIVEESLILEQENLGHRRKERLVLCQPLMDLKGLYR